MSSPHDPRDRVAALLRPGGVTAVYQPIVRVADGAVIGYEALARATADPSVPPPVWLHEAEVAGCRAEVELACLEAAAQAGAPPDGAVLFVNVSPDVLVRPDFRDVARRLPRHVLEVTEDAAVADYEPLLTALGALRSDGALVAVDDVGSGYASMAHVLNLSPSFVKIDRSLVQGLHADPGRRALVQAMQAFASAIGAVTVAEGVETAEELRELKEIGVDLAQGYLLARPGAAWQGVGAEALGVLQPQDEAPAVVDVGSLQVVLERTATPGEACDVVGQFLSRHGGLLPSVYLERGGVLRCQSRRGQWLVMDGLLPGSGITGSAFATEQEILVQDVRADPRYRMAIPGVSSELAVPLRVGTRTVGVLNVDAVAPLSPDLCALVRLGARLLEDQLALLGARGRRGSTLHELSRLAPRLALAGTATDLRRETLAAVAELTGFDAGCWWELADTSDGEPLVASSWGRDPALLTTLDVAQVGALRGLVAELSSCYSGGTDLSLAVPGTQVLQERGARGAIIVPIRDGWRLTDVVALTSAATSFLTPDVVDAVESLCLQAGSRLAALRRVAELEGLVHRDPLTGLGNRGLWELALADAATGPAVWVALADVDRFKGVNDTRGHLAGDGVLRLLADAFGDGLPGWSAFRLGGDEFALLGPAADGASRPRVLADVTARINVELARFGAGLSVGAVRAVGDGVTSGVELADQALYRRKRAGGAGLSVAGALAGMPVPAVASVAPGVVPGVPHARGPVQTSVEAPAEA